MQLRPDLVVNHIYDIWQLIPCDAFCHVDQATRSYCSRVKTEAMAALYASTVTAALQRRNQTSAFVLVQQNHCRFSVIHVLGELQ